MPIGTSGFPGATSGKARLADLGGTVLPGSPAEFGKLINRRHREVGQGDQVPRIKPE
jgi:hypothetical protein